MRFLIISLLLLTGCSSISDGITCTYRNGQITCGSTGMTQDLLAQGAEDEKPDWPSVQSLR